jgi:hypothetical protein
MAIWKADVPERRMLFRASSTGDTGGLRARYPDYAIHGNAVLLCGGANEEDAQSHCLAMITAFDSAPQ